MRDYIEFKKDIDPIKNDLIDISLLIENHIIKFNLNKIKLATNFKIANKYFDVIEDFIPFIQKVKFVHKLDIGVYLNNSIKYFDRIDDKTTRKFFFKILKKKGVTVESIWSNL